MPSELVISTAESGDLLPAASLAAKAMIDLPENQVVFRGREDRMKAVFCSLFKEAPGDILIAKDERSGELLGMMRLVAWPRCKPDFIRKFVSLPQMALALKGTLPRAAKMQGAWAKEDPQWPHLHLDPLAVSVDAQGKGIGSGLMRHYCERLDRENVAGYLETGRETSVYFYQKSGFQVTGKIEVLGVPIWLMERPTTGQAA